MAESLTSNPKVIPWTQLKKQADKHGVEIEVYVESMNAHIENQRRAIVRLTQERDDAKADFLRVHKEYMDFKYPGSSSTEAGCTRSHPHENMDAECEALTVAARRAHETPAPLVSWRLTDEHINSLQVASVDRLIKRAKAAHYVNVRVRINGDWEEHEADWIKHMKREGSPAEEAVHGIGAPVGELTDEMREVMRHNSASVDQMEKREPSLHQPCLDAQVADAIQRFGPPLTEKETAAPPEFAPDSECIESDGCPTEGAVLKRFWRAHHQDIERFRYLTEDIADRVDRQRRNELLARMVVMSYSAACSDIDIAMSERAPLKAPALPAWEDARSDDET